MAVRRRRLVKRGADDQPARRLSDFMDNHGRPVGEAAKRRAKQPAVVEARKNAVRCGSTGIWASAGAAEIVGLYAMFHEEVYGVEAEELSKGPVFASARRAAAKMIREHFEGDVDTAAHFMQWIWTREKGREEWAKKEGKNRSRLGFRICFSATAVTDYRVDQKRGRR